MSRTRTLVATILIAGAAAILPAVAQAQCVPVAFPAGWLQAQEALGGHTIARHVGKTIQELIDRIFNEGVPASGSFPTVNQAQNTISAALTANAGALNNWRATGAVGGVPVNVGAAYVLNTTAAGNIGTVAYTVGNPPSAVSFGPTCAIRIVIRATGGNTCRVLTAFPRPATPEDHCP